MVFELLNWLSSWILPPIYRDGLLNAFDKKLQARAPDEKLKAEVASLKQTVDMLLDHLGLAVEPSPKKVIKRVRIADETNTLDTL